MKIATNTDFFICNLLKKEKKTLNKYGNTVIFTNTEIR